MQDWWNKLKIDGTTGYIGSGENHEVDAALTITVEASDGVYSVQKSFTINVVVPTMLLSGMLMLVRILMKTSRLTLI